MSMPLVATLIYPSLCTFEFGCAAEVFGLPRPELGKALYSFTSFSVEKKPVHALGGVSMTAMHDLKVLKKAKLIIIPGWRPESAKVTKILCKELRAAFRRGTRIASICSGVNLLAEAGLLENKRAAIHWRHADQFKKNHPNIQIDENVLYVDEGQILTSAGSAAGLDLCLHILRKDYGADIANTVARRLVLPPHREGGQAQFIPAPVSAADQKDQLSVYLDLLRSKLMEQHTLSSMAASLDISKRSLLRRFKRSTGLSPINWLTLERIKQAQNLLETTKLNIEQISEKCGFGSTESLRLHFRRSLHTSPQLYRKQFGTLA